ncbi:MAG TPA: DUF2127 domain-containing protein [Chthoniobacterales bacterium]|nr:DUF2127 domain-containing protein [Chthoniobacterales bacterium]
MTRSSKHHSARRRALFGIAIFKWIKGALLLAVAAGAISLFHKDVQTHVEHWITVCRIDPDNLYIAAALEKLDLVHTRELKQLSFLSAFYAAIFLTEGTGLALRKRWAEYLTIIATGLLIPLEIYELWKTPTVLKGALLLGNIAIVVFLVWIVRSKEA